MFEISSTLVVFSKGKKTKPACLVAVSRPAPRALTAVCPGARYPQTDGRHRRRPVHLAPRLRRQRCAEKGGGLVHRGSGTGARREARNGLGKWRQGRRYATPAAARPLTRSLLLCSSFAARKPRHQGPPLEHLATRLGRTRASVCLGEVPVTAHAPAAFGRSRRDTAPGKSAPTPTMTVPGG